MDVVVRRLGSQDLALVAALNGMFGAAFEDPESYCSARPSEEYLQSVLSRDDVIVLAAIAGGQVVGGLAAYVLHKLEQERTEIYIYDLAVAEAHRRRGIARQLIEWLREYASDVGAWVIYVQADHGDAPAISLYESLGTREDVLHFDISPRRTDLQA
jgi:aminoglycoside 3-N-acetyltransferase I